MKCSESRINLNEVEAKRPIQIGQRAEDGLNGNPKLDRLILGRVRGGFARQFPDLIAERRREGITGNFIPAACLLHAERFIWQINLIIRVGGRLKEWMGEIEGSQMPPALLRGRMKFRDSGAIDLY